jgi:hypothetical protein
LRDVQSQDCVVLAHAVPVIDHRNAGDFVPARLDLLHSVDNIYALYASNGTVKWEFPLNNSTSSSPMVDANGTIYIGTKGGNFFAVNPNGTQSGASACPRRTPWAMWTLSRRWDRDGTVSEEVGYLDSLTKLILLPQAFAAIKKINNKPASTRTKDTPKKATKKSNDCGLIQE